MKLKRFTERGIEDLYNKVSPPELGAFLLKLDMPALVRLGFAKGDEVATRESSWSLTPEGVRLFHMLTLGMVGGYLDASPLEELLPQIIETKEAK